MFSSIQCAARWPGWKTGLTHWAIILGDQPQLRIETLRDLLCFAAAHPHAVCQPAFHGHPKHPVLLPRSLFQQLSNTPAATLRQFLAPLASEIKLHAAADPAFDFDIDTPADYEEAVRRWHSAVES
jgi:CTP:molybdopterin cytidylyltransferase MocA